MKDDALGMRVAQALKKRDLGENVSVEEHPDMDLTVIERLRGASKVIIVDSVRGGESLELFPSIPLLLARVTFLNCPACIV